MNNQIVSIHFIQISWSLGNCWKSFFCVRKF